MRKFLLTAAMVLAAGPAMAHTGHGEASGLVHGLVHPLLGTDHLLAMLAVGLWSGFVLPSRFWAGAATFLLAMTLGAGLGFAGVHLPLVEETILASVVALGAMLVVSTPGQPAAATTASLAAIAVFAACHGHAHAAEATGDAAGYVAGFLLATVALHVVGVGVALATARHAAGDVIRRGLGGAFALAGVLLAAG